jgi:hypothetical protein
MSLDAKRWHIGNTLAALLFRASSSQCRVWTHDTRCGARNVWLQLSISIADAKAGRKAATVLVSAHRAINQRQLVRANNVRLALTVCVVHTHTRGVAAGIHMTV